MSVDVRVDPEVSIDTIAGEERPVSALLLGGTPRGAAIVLVGADGLRSVEAVDVMNGLAQHGFESVMAELGDPWRGDDFDRALFRHLLRRVGERGWSPEQVGVIGYGQGARSAMVAGSEMTLGAAVSVPRHARQIVGLGSTLALRTPWLGMTGVDSRDGAGDALSSFHRQIDAASTSHTGLVSYPGVTHCLDDSVDAVVHQAAFDSWQRTVEWLNIHVAPRPTPLVQAWNERQTRDESSSH